tara:strand:- start:3120 stop:3674 length:555 start_codon:yes stop_codon:yes gene_type:complete
MKVKESINIYNGLVSKEKLNNINNILLDSKFPWYFNPETSENDYNFPNTFEHFQLSHWFIFNSKIGSESYINVFRNTISNIPIEHDLIVRAKVNLLPQFKHDKDRHNNPHLDVVREDNRKHKICIVYLNDSDGDTFVFNNNKEIIKRITPEAGKVLIMDGNLIHTSAHPIEAKYRLVFNINFLI